MVSLMRILIIQHDPLCGLDMFERPLKESGVELVFVHPDAGDALPEPHDFDGVIALGSPYFAWQSQEHPSIDEEPRFVGNVVEQLQLPFLGICFGHQLLAKALGGGVRIMAQPECGLLPVALTGKGRSDPLFCDIDYSTNCIQWHASEVTGLPKGAELLASSAQCAVQAFRFGKHAYGLQGHYEVGPETLENWLSSPLYSGTFFEANPDQSAGLFSAEAKSSENEIRTAAQTIAKNFASIVLTHKNKCLGNHFKSAAIIK